MTKSKKSADQIVGDRLAQLRRTRGFSQAELAEKLGLDQSGVSDYERGVRRLHAEAIIELTKVLGVTSDDVLGLQDNPDGMEHLKPFLKQLRHVERLSTRDRQALLRTINAFLERAELKQTAKE